MLACIAHPDSRFRDIAQAVTITERTVSQIVGDLENAGYVSKIRDGRRNRYEIKDEVVRTPALSTMTIRQLLGLLLDGLEKQPLA